VTRRLALVLIAVPRMASAEPRPDDDAEHDGEVREVVVTGTRTEQGLADTPVATQVYDREDIEDSGAENLGEILEETPGVQLDRGIGGVGISMQGLGPSYTVVLVDGQRMTGRVDNVLDLSRFPAEDIEQVEVVRGPSSVLYGADALAGTVNLISRKPVKPHEAEVHAAYGSFDTADLTGRVGLSREHYAGSLTGGWHRTDGYDLEPDDVSTDGPRRNQWHLTSTHELREIGPFSLWMRGSYLQRDGLLVDATDTGAVFDRRNRSEVLTATLRPSLDFGHARVTFGGGYNLWRDQFVNDQRASTELDQQQDTFDHLGQATVQYDHEIGKHVITVGGDGQFEVLSTQRIEPPRVDRQRYAVFAQDEWTPSAAPEVVVLPGVRLDYDTFFGIYPTPRIALMVAPDPRWTFRASYGRGFRAPSFREMFLLFANPSAGYTVAGNPSLRPETSWSASFSAEVRPWQWMWLAANVFDNRLRDTIVTDSVDPADVDTPTLFEYVNIGQATTRGVETQSSIGILDVLTIDGSYTFVHSRDDETGRPLPGRPRHSATAGLRFYREAWGTGLRVRSAIYGARSFFADTDGDDIEDEQRSDPFATLDVRLSQRFVEYVQVFVGVENVLDAGNPTDNPLPPRSWYGGVTIRY
jgi:outer membrane receptor for ferrienterochelin and colicins